MNRLISFVIAIVLWAGPLASAARADDGRLERLIVESADTPQEHAALASYYDGKAADARRLANHHRSMGKAYGGVKLAETFSLNCNTKAFTRERWMLPSLTVIEDSTGGGLKVTLMAMISESVCVGASLSVTMTRTLYTVPACAALGVQVNTPPVVMLAPAGAPAPRLNVTGPPSGSVAVAVKVKVAPSVMVLPPIVPSTGVPTPSSAT